MIGELGEFFEWIRTASLGWQYLFSPSYRRNIHEGWKYEKWYYVVWDIICGTAGILFSLEYYIF